jgi:hypothetical protein
MFPMASVCQYNTIRSNGDYMNPKIFVKDSETIAHGINGCVVARGNESSHVIQSLVDSIPENAVTKIEFIPEKYYINNEIDLSHHVSLSLEMPGIGWRTTTPCGFYADADLRSVFNIDNLGYANSYALGVLRNLHIVGNPATHGIRLARAFGVRIEGCSISNCNTGIYSASGGDNHRYIDCWIVGNIAGIYDSGAGTIMDRVYVSESQKNGIQLAGTTKTIRDSQIYRSNVGGGGYSNLDLTNATYCNIVNCEIYTVDQGMSGTGVKLWRNCNQNTIRECKIFNNDRGVVIDAAPDTSCTDNDFIDNRIFSNRVGVFQGASGGQVESNRFLFNKLYSNIENSNGIDITAQ